MKPWLQCFALHTQDSNLILDYFLLSVPMLWHDPKRLQDNNVRNSYELFLLVNLKILESV